MQYSEAAIVNGQLVEKNVKIIDQSTLTYDCGMVQVSGLEACKACKYRGKKDCGGGKILKRLKKSS
jgi:hypothetical protein